MNREQRRQMGKGQSDERVEVAAIAVHFTNGQVANLDIHKVTIVDKDTDRPLFQEVLEPIAPQLDAGRPAKPREEFAGELDPQSYTVQFDTPEGKMEYVKNGNWAGVRPVGGLA